MKEQDDQQETKNHVDEDLIEHIDDEEMHELVMQARADTLERARAEEQKSKKKRRFSKIVPVLIAVAMTFYVLSLFPRVISVPAVDFLQASSRLSQDEQVAAYKEAVVVIETNDGRGTGFAISDDGTILTNHHVIEDDQTVTVAFPEEGLFQGEVVEEMPEIDLAVVEVEGEGLPHLTLDDTAEAEYGDYIRFIGNPLFFNGIANEGTILGPLQLSGWEEEVMMIRAPVYRGNSGSPVINQEGNVIGVIFATLNHDDHGRIGLFIPINYFTS
ncbi:S1C family serine protease [Oceanobacillus jeddahense]|uniref:Serine protease n=1 Tax=Oceanobacillus jeddahense TaxID=1462527 RepID=A0ABY5K180_9BACI|nr:serine protease [Oceanobacillus jeddahense]UUI05123.1 serine protease [Oceanobacillus jeddahense]